jgi:hypothetical protein
MSGRRSPRLLLSFLAFPALILAGATACQPAPPPPHNDSFAAPTLLAGTGQGQAAGTTTGATLQAGESAKTGRASVWFHWTAPQSGAARFATMSALPVAVEAYTGTTWGHLLEVGSDNGGGSSAFRVVAGTVYSIRVTGTVGGAFSLKWATSTAPANDASAAAVALVTGTGSVVADSTAATTEPGDPLIEGGKTPATVWYRWTAPADGWYEFDTHGSQISTELGVYTDTTPRQLVDDSAGDCASFVNFGQISAGVKFPATSGTSYLVMVGGSDADEPSANSLGGPLQLNWRPVVTAPVASSNDAFASPDVITGTHGVVSGTTDGATAEPSEPAKDGLTARNSVWFSFTPTVTGTYALSTFSSLSDECPAALAVYTGDTLAGLQGVPNVDEGITPMSSLPGAARLTISSFFGGDLRVHLVAGTQYRISVDRLFQPGPFTLSWDIPQAAPAIRAVSAGNGSIGVVWSPPPATAGSALSGYFVEAMALDGSFDGSEPQLLPANASFTTLHGLKNGTSYQVMVTALNDSGWGEPAISKPVTPKR